MNKEDEIKRIKETERGREAMAVLESRVYQEAWATVTDNLRARMGGENVADDELVEAHKALRILAQVRRQVEVAMQTGKLAERQLEDERSRRKG